MKALVKCGGRIDGKDNLQVNKNNEMRYPTDKKTKY